MTKAKRHPLLSQVVAGNVPETTVEILDHSYTLRLLKPEGEDWAAIHTAGFTAASALLNVRNPTLACALTAIDEVPVESLFTPEDSEKDLLAADSQRFRDWRREQVLAFVREDMDQVVVDKLYAKYKELSEKHREELRGMPGFSKGTTSEG